MRSSWWSRGLEAGRERLLPARVLLYAALLPLILRFRKLPDLPAWVEPAGELPPPPAPEAVTALVERIDALLVAGRPAVRTGCMIRGLTLYRFLRRAGAEVSLHFGVGTLRGEFAAHCWVVYRGEPLEETVDPRPIFTETWRIEPSPPIGQGFRRGGACPRPGGGWPVAKEGGDKPRPYEGGENLRARSLP